MLSPKQALNKSFLAQPVIQNDVDNFKVQIEYLLSNLNNSESEEHNKNLISSTLHKLGFENHYFINTKNRNDLVIHTEKTSQSQVGVIIETKSPSNRSEMPTLQNLNCKATQELVLYFLRERFVEKNLELKNLIITNGLDWFVFDATVFEKCFGANKTLVKEFNNFNSKTLFNESTDFFYKEIAPKYILLEHENLLNSCCYFNLKNTLESCKEDKQLIPLIKILSPTNLLKLSFNNDSNSLDKSFYHELLHIIGLDEVKVGGKKLIQRKLENKRDTGSLIENTISQLQNEERKLYQLSEKDSFGQTQDEQIFGIALQLCITWINRILFLKLLESQLISYNKTHIDQTDFKFLSYSKIASLDELDNLFFGVLAKLPENRSASNLEKYSQVPYLNSSLFEPTNLEDHFFRISQLQDNQDISVLNNTVLKNNQGQKTQGELNTIQYLFQFLDSYAFGSNAGDEILETNKTIINSSVLGLIFEKINGYKDGSFFTPSFITMYMARTTVQKAILTKFNQNKNWNCENFTELYNKIEDKQEANQIVNSLKIVDPAVGSGHFLVSVLNEIIFAKSYLNILQDENGKTLKDYHIVIENDELIITNENGDLFEYKPASPESQRVQQTLFHEKQTIIENCLFGVDINPNSVKICSLRLWIELLKNTYYKENNQLQTLPNIDINIKTGNSLISRYSLETNIKTILKDKKWSIKSYKNAVKNYQNANSKKEKYELEEIIADIKTDFKKEVSSNSKDVKRRDELKNQVEDLFVGIDDRGRKQIAKELAEVEAKIKNLETNPIYNNAFEWRFEFPEVLNEEGNFEGFDVVIGNPPYIKEYEGKEFFNGLHEKEVYQGKMDIWYLFGALGLQLIKPESYLCFIAQNNWITSSGASKFRNKIISESRIEKLIDFGSYMVFDSASIQTMIMLFRKNAKDDNYVFDFSRVQNDLKEEKELIDFLTGNDSINFESFKPTILRKNYENKSLTFNSNNFELVLQKIESVDCFRLDGQNELSQGVVAPQDFVNAKSAEVTGIKKGSGIFNLTDEEFKNLNLSESEKHLIKPFYTSNEIKKYFGTNRNEMWLIYTDSSFKNQDSLNLYPNIKQHLDKFSKVITSDNKPYGLHRSRNNKFFIGEKIISLRKCSEPTFTYTNFDCYVSQTYNIIKTDRANLIYLTGLLNSSLVKFYFRYKGKMQGNIFQIDSEPLQQLPIPTLNTPEKQDLAKQIEDLVQEILKLKELDPQSNISVQETEIDNLVFALYGLNEEEIKLVLGY